jgi:hypothetical protein
MKKKGSNNKEIYLNRGGNTGEGSLKEGTKAGLGKKVRIVRI